jgi:hypothetical protein
VGSWDGGSHQYVFNRGGSGTITASTGTFNLSWSIEDEGKTLNIKLDGLNPGRFLPYGQSYFFLNDGQLKGLTKKN